MNDNTFMRRAIDLARQGRGSVEPNPMVGCVIVQDGRIVGEGFHARYGSPHAEPTALASLRESAEGATAYVTLEPCCHSKKQTPPCVPQLIEAKIKRVVIGSLDPNPLVNGKGIAWLRNAGITVDTGVLESECATLIEAFATTTSLGRPFITLKWAQTADGALAAADGSPIQISGPEASHAVHTFRARCDAIMVSGNTIRTDDPSLTARNTPVQRVARRIVIDRSGIAPKDARVFTSEHPHETIVYSPRLRADLNSKRVGQYNLTNLSEIMTHLWVMFRVQHFLVEPGPRLIHALVSAGLFDRIWIIRSPMTFATSSNFVAPDISNAVVETAKTKCGRDTVTEYRPAYTKPPLPSIDFDLFRQ